MSLSPKDMIAINRAMGDPDNLAIKLHYTDKEGAKTERVVSPIRWIDTKSIMVLCLCREQPRRLELDRCSSIQTLDAADVLMPVEIKTVVEMEESC